MLFLTVTESVARIFLPFSISFFYMALLVRDIFSTQHLTYILTCICLMAGGLLVKMWCQSDTRRDVRALHDVMSDMSHGRQDFVTWLLHANAHPASRISQYDNSHPVRCFWILLEFCNTIVRVWSRVIRDMIIEL